MAVLAVKLVSPAIFMDDNPNISNDIESFPDWFWVQPPLFHVEEPSRACDTINNMPVAMPGYEIQTRNLHSYFEDLYFRVQLVPAKIELGNLLSAQTREFGLWNAWLEPVVVNSVTATGLNGVQLTSPAGYTTTPFTMAPNLEIIYTLTVSVEGAPTINGSIHWDTDHNDVTLSITGARVILFPFRPDWKGGIDETISTRSSLSRTHTGAEQGVSLRDRDRRAYSMQYTLTGVDAQRFDNLMFGWQSRLFGLPLWPEEGYTSAAIVPTDTVINISTTGRTLVPGGLLMIYDVNPSDNDVREIKSVTSSTVEVTIPFTRGWSKGARVDPLTLAMINPSLSGTRQLPTSMSASIAWECEPSQTDPLMPIVAPAALYRGEELYFGRTNWRDGVSVSFNSDGQKIDMNTGKFRIKPLSGYTGLGRSHDWLFPALEDVLAFRAWLKRRAGKVKGVWMPSGLQDFTWAANALAAENVVHVLDNGYNLLVAQNEVRRDVYIRFNDGTFMVRRIISSAGDPGGKTISLGLDAALGRNVAPGQVKQFSFLSYYRLSSDDTQIHWHVPGIAEATTGLITTKSAT